MKRIVTLFALGLASTACGPERTADVLALTGDATNGATLYGTHCAGCHGDDGRSGSVGEDIVHELGDDGAEVIDTMITGDGDMPAFDQLSDQEMADIVAHMKTL